MGKNPINEKGENNQSDDDVNPISLQGEYKNSECDPGRRRGDQQQKSQLDDAPTVERKGNF